MTIRTNERITKDGGAITGARPVRKSSQPKGAGKAGVGLDAAGSSETWTETWGAANHAVREAERRSPRPANDAVQTSGDQGAAAEVPEDVLAKAAEAGWASGKVLAEEGISRAEAE